MWLICIENRQSDMILGELKAIRINIFFPTSLKTIKIAVNNYFRSFPFP